MTTLLRRTNKVRHAALVAREYLRVSLDRSGRAKSLTEQHTENAKAADAEGWRLGDEYRDKAGASRHSRKVRDDFVRLLEDLERDRFGAQVLILWESSRGSRKVGEWVTLIDLCERRQVLIFVTTHGRSYDPANPRDRRSLLEDAVDSEYETSKLSLRLRRGNAAAAAEGKPHGRLLYGYTRIYDPKTRRLVEQQAVPGEAKVIRELFRRLLKEHALNKIAVDFEKRGIRSRSGKVFSPQHLRMMALNPSYAGLRVYDPGRKSGGQLSDQATYTEGTWKGLVTPRVFWATHRLLTAPERRTSRPGRGKHQLSMIARCDVCSGPLAVRYRRETTQYWCCGTGHVWVDKAELDALAEKTMLDYLRRPDVYADLSAGDEADERLATVRDELAEKRARHDGFAREAARGKLTPSLLVKIEAELLPEITALEQQERELATPSALAELMAPGQDVARRWKQAEMSTRREVARLLLSPAKLGELRVTRTPTPGHKVPVQDRVRWRTE